MKKSKSLIGAISLITCSSLLAIYSTSAFAEKYLLRLYVEGVVSNGGATPGYNWESATPIYGEWTFSGTQTCGDWEPGLDSFNDPGSYLQSKDCAQSQSRTVQQRFYSPQKR